jgi:hypothetical protein
MWAAPLLLMAPLITWGATRAVFGPQMGSLMLPTWLGSMLWAAMVVGVMATTGGRRWIIANRFQLLLCAATTVLALAVIGEAAVRIVAESDEDGNTFVRGHHLRPRQLPVRRIEAVARMYFGSSTSFMMADPLLGWAPRPGAKTNGYTYNTQGVRVVSRETTFGPTAPPGKLRVALFGDSYTNGAEVRDDETWGVYAESALQQLGVPVEVLNFGVNGYGMDQAFLRWRHVGRRYRPSVVVFGLQLENAKRNMNLIRPLYQRTTELLPFAKPRFVPEGERLTLINSPVVPLEQLPATVRNMASWPLARFEGYYNPSDYLARPWHASKLFMFATQVISESVSPSANDNVTTAGERDLALRILDAFRRDVEATGSRFLVYYLPKRHELRALNGTGSVPDAEFVRQVEERFDVISAADTLLAEARRTSLSSLYASGGHYSSAGNKVVGRLLAERLSALGEDLTVLVTQAISAHKSRTAVAPQ